MKPSRRKAMQAFSSYFSLGVSICTAVMTFLVWVLKASRERARLKIYAAEAQIGGWAQSSCGDPIKLSFEVKSVVANYSTLPNAVLAAQAAVLLRDGSWHAGETRIDAKTPMPFNLAPLQTVKLDLSFVVPLPAVPEGEACKNTQEPSDVYCDLSRFNPLQVKVMLTSLGDKQSAAVLRSTAAPATPQLTLRKAA